MLYSAPNQVSKREQSVGFVRSSGHVRPKPSVPIHRPAGWYEALAKAYARVETRPYKELTFSGTKSGARGTFTAFFDDALIAAEELGLPVYGGLRMPFCEVEKARFDELVPMIHVWSVRKRNRQRIQVHDLYIGSSAVRTWETPDPIQAALEVAELERLYENSGKIE